MKYMKSKSFKAKWIGWASLCTVGAALSAHAGFIPLGQATYFQNFNSLASSGKSMSMPLGWTFQNLALPGGKSDNFYLADDGSSSAGGTYSYGLAGSTNRALGSLLGPGGRVGVFGATFQNTGPHSINRLNISYTGEEWRLGAAGQQDRLQFQYSLNSGGSISSGTWINDSALDFSAPNLTGVGAHNGTLAANQENISGSIAFLNLPVGATIAFRWEYVPANPNETAGDGLAIDNFSITAVPEVSTWLAAICALVVLGRALYRSSSLSEPLLRVKPV
jgi:hypothetical protein